MDINYENAYTRGLPGGEYIVNVHLYRYNGELPLKVAYKITLGTRSGARKVILDGIAELEYVRHELTIVRFTISEDGKFIESSVHAIQIPIRTKKKQDRAGI